MTCDPDKAERKQAEKGRPAGEVHTRIRSEPEANASVDALSEHRFREIIEHAPYAILQVDTAGRIVLANSSAESMFGYKREELLTLNVDMLVPEAQRAGHAGQRRAFLAAGITRTRSGSGRMRREVVSGSSFRAPDENLVELAIARNADLIIFDQRRGLISPHLHGGILADVVATAPCPVLAIPSLNSTAA